MAKRPGNPPVDEKRIKDWTKVGTEKIAKGVKPGYFQDINGRFRIRGSGRFVSADKAAKGFHTIDVFVGSRSMGTSGLVEVTYKAKFPRGFKGDRPSIVDAVSAKMRERGHRTLIGKDKSLTSSRPIDKVKFFSAFEGEAYDVSTKKTERSTTGIQGRANLDVEREEAKSKMRALMEGSSLANKPNPTGGSDKRYFRKGPDTFYLTAVYGPNVPAPDVDIFPKPKRRTRSKRK